MAWPPTGFVQASIASSATRMQTAIAISAATVVRDSPRDRRPTVAGPEAAVAIVDAAPAAPTGLVAAEWPDPIDPPDLMPPPDPIPPADPPESGFPKVAAE
jgi:hypothetical protein